MVFVRNNCQFGILYSSIPTLKKASYRPSLHNQNRVKILGKGPKEAWNQWKPSSRMAVDHQ